MGTVPVPHTWVAGDDATSSALQTLTDALLYLLGSTTSGGSRRPVAKMRQTVSQSIPTATWTAATFDAEDVDYDNGHSTVTNTDRYTAATTGWHFVTGTTGFGGNATGRRGTRAAVNGVAVNGSEGMIAAGVATPVTPPAPGTWVFLNAGDILRLECWQDSGGALGTAVGSSNQPSMSLEWRSN